MYSFPFLYPASHRRGFTLIEMMVAVTITSLLIILITQITASFLDYWPKAEGKLKKNMDARMVLELIAQDLQAAVLRGQERPASFQWMQWRYNTDPGNPLPQTIYTNPVTGMLMFFTSAVDRDTVQSGNVCAVAYRLAYQKPLGNNSADKIFALYRTLVETAPTFKDAIGQTDLYTGYWSLNSATSLDPKNFLIANVLDFSLTFHVIAPDGTRQQLPPRTTLNLGPTLTIGSLDPSSPAPVLQAGTRLESIDISLTITTSQGSKRITESHNNIANLLLPTVDTFNRRVQLTY